MASEYTPNRRYPLYTDTDKPNLRDQYNGAIREIDTDMAQALSDSSAVSAALGSGFDAQHTVRMAIEAKADSSALTAETTARENADTALGTRITNETSARESADTALGTRITNETTARESADTALGTRITNETNARQSADTALDARIDSLEAQKHMVVIGDSFSSTTYQPASTAWYTLVAQQLNVTPHCYAKDSSGFVHVGAGNNTFYSELELANDDTSFSNDDVEWVFIYGGLNDMNANDYSAAFSSACKNTINRAHTLFGKAKIVVMGVNSWKGNLAKITVGSNQVNQLNAQYNIRSLKHDSSCAPFAFIPMAFAYGFVESYYDSSNGHPNASGHSVVANMVLDALFGTCEAEPSGFNVNLLDSSNNVVGSAIVMPISPNTFRMSGSLTFASNAAIAPHDSRNIMPALGITYGSGLPIIFGNGTGFIASTSFNPAGNTGTGFFNTVVIW